MPTTFHAFDIRAEDALILRCARTNINNENAEQIKLLIHRGINWRYLLRSAAYHRVVPLLYRSLRQASLEHIPPSVVTKLRNHCNTISRNNLILTARLLEVLELLDAHHIPAIPYKGVALALLAYGDITLRDFRDLDILVHPEDYLNAQNTFFANGYHLARDWGWECALVHNGMQICVDLHRAIVPERFRLNIDFATLHSDLEPLPLSGGKIKTLSPEDMLLVLCIQLFKDAADSAPLRLIKVCDIAELLEKHPDLNSERVLTQITALGSPEMILDSLSVTHRLLDTPLPELLLKSLRSPHPDDLPAHMCRKIINKIGYRRFNLTLVPNERDRALLPLPEGLSALYYLLRPIRLTRDYSRAFWHVAKEYMLTQKKIR